MSKRKTAGKVRSGYRQLVLNSVLAMRIGWEHARSWFAGNLIMMAIVSVIPAAQTWLMRDLINGVTNLSGDLVRFVPLVSIIIVLTLIDVASSQLQSYFLANLSATLRVRVDNIVVGHAARLDQMFIESSAHQDILQRATQSMGQHIGSFIDNTLRALTQLFRLISVTSLVFAINPVTVLVALPLAVPYVFFRWYFASKAYEKEYSRAERRRWIRYFTSLLLHPHAAQEVRIFGVGQALVKSFQSITDDFLDEDIQLARQQMHWGLLLDIVFAVLLYGAIGYAMLQSFLRSVPFGDLFAYTRAALQLQIAIQTVTRTMGLSLEHGFYLDDFQQFIRHTPSMQEGRIEIAAVKSRPIEFRNVSFKYPGVSTYALTDVSLRINPGECVALVGVNGSGKSTLIKLLLRQYDPTQGTITIGEHLIYELTFDSLYQQFTYIAQIYNRYETSFKNNIYFPDSQRIPPDHETYTKSIDLSQLTSILSQLPEGDETILGRHFGRYELSLGQWQRLAVARMLAHPAPIMLLDEPTSSLDTISEDLLLTDIINAHPNKTKVFVSHRFSTIQKADRVIVMQNGRIVQNGRHEELLNEEGEYRLLYQSAYRGMISRS